MNEDMKSKEIERIERFMTLCHERSASDIHLSSGLKPYIRLNGKLVCMRDEEPIPLENMQALAQSLMNDRQLAVFEEKKDLDIGYSSKSGSRFRINVYSQRAGLSIAMRRLDDKIQDLEDWNLPSALGDLTECLDGLVIATGPTGSGKSTTLATLISRVARQRSSHIITIEDPVEYVHQSGRSLIHQRELHTDVPSFADAVRSAMREDPDVLLVGEMRDLDTMRAGITAAETGHLVFTTLHTGDAVGSIERMVGLFPASEQDSIRQQLSLTLRAVIAQKLVPNTRGDGRVPAVELLLVTPAAANLIRTGRTEQIYSVMESGSTIGMRTLEQDLARLTIDGTISPKTARREAKKREILEEWLRTDRETMAGLERR